MTETNASTKPRDVEDAAPRKQKDRLKQKPSQRTRLNFSDESSRQSHLDALYSWLPEDLQTAPYIDWSQVPSSIIGYLVRTIGADVSAPYMALALGSLLGGMTAASLKGQMVALRALLREMLLYTGSGDPASLAERATWESYAAQVEMTTTRFSHLSMYATLTEQYIRHYLERLDTSQRDRLQRYAFPLLPARFLRRDGRREAFDEEAQRRRKERSDVMLPLYPILVQLIQFRKQAAERLIKRFRAERSRMERGEVSLPHAFSYEDTIPTINRDARSVAEVEIVGRPVTLQFVLWDRRSWVQHHQERYANHTIYKARVGGHNYDEERNIPFLQCVSRSTDLLWFGDLIELRLLHHLSEASNHDETYNERLQRAKELGVLNGFMCSRGGLIAPGYDMGLWFARAVAPGEMVFEPEAIYRGVLYGAALATIALTNGGRASELLQVSVDRFETIMVDEVKGGQPTGKKVPLYVQQLLPKGGQTEEQRQFFPMSRQAVRLLKEIHMQLVAVHGEVPVVDPSRESVKFEQLSRERYLFQWNATPDGRKGILGLGDVTKLLRFVLHGLEMYTAKGEPIRVTAHLLRHVTATGIRIYHRVPLEAIAFMLHHRQQIGRDDGAAIPAATKYYSQTPVEHHLIQLHAFQQELEANDSIIVMQPLTERDLESMNEDLREVLERWGTILPTAFGYCGCPGLCIREHQRSLCIGCPFLIPDYSKAGQAEIWRASYARQAKALDDEGNTTDARQKWKLVHQLDDLITLMRLQQQAEADGGYIPAYKALPFGVERSIHA